MSSGNISSCGCVGGITPEGTAWRSICEYHTQPLVTTTSKVNFQFTPDPETPKKSDAQKPDMSLLHRYPLEQTALAFMDGAAKYGRNNFRENGGLEWNRLLAAALRHLTAFNSGENVASDSGLSHLSHAAANIFMLLEYEGTNNGIDNRFVVDKSSKSG